MILNFLSKLFKINNRKSYKVSKDEFINAAKLNIKNEYMNDDVFNNYLDNLYDEIKLPKRATKGSGGYDFYAPYGFCLQPNEETTIPTGIKASMNLNNILFILPRSSLGFKYRARLANTVGLIDSDYYDNIKNEGHIMIKIVNEGNKMMTIHKGDAFAQGVFINYLTTNDDCVNETRIGGFGSTNGKSK